MTPIETTHDPSVRDGLEHELTAMFGEVRHLMDDVDDAAADHAMGTTWPIRRQMHHLTKSVGPVVLGLRLPKWALRLLFGTNDGPVRTMDQLITAYDAAMGPSPQSPRAYVPSGRASLERMNRQWTALETGLMRSLDTWTDAELDRLRLPHPTIGRMPVREILLFTLYHTRVHLRRMHEILDHHRTTH